MDKATGQNVTERTQTATFDAARDDAYRPVMNVGALEADAQKSTQAASTVKEEPLEDVLKQLPIPPRKELLAQVLGITSEPVGNCDTRLQSPEITGNPIKNTCDLPLEKILDETAKSVTQAIARPLGPDENNDGKPDKEVPFQFGTAFLLCDKDECYYVTNAHVAGNADSVGLVSADGKTLQYGKVLNRDEEKDLVIVERPTGDTRVPVDVGSMPKVNDSVFIVGHPLGSPWNVVSPGQVMDLDASMSLKDPATGKVKKYEHLIQSQVRALPGNSGGPEFNDKGEVIGVKVLANRAGSASIPIKEALEEIREVKAKH